MTTRADDTNKADSRSRLDTIGYSVGFTALWLALALWRDGVTYHLAPILIPLIPAYLYRSGAGRTSTSAGAALAVGAGGTLAAGGSLVLAAFDRMNGPTLLPFGGALVESLLFSALGVAFALLIARPWRPSGQ